MLKYPALWEIVILGYKYFLFYGLISSHHEMWRKLFLEKYKKFLRSGFFVCFLFRLSAGSLLKYKKLFKLGVRKFHFSKYKKLFKTGVSFDFSRSKSYFPKLKKVPFPKMAGTFLRFPFSRNIWKAFFWKDIRNFLNLRSEKFLFLKCNKFSWAGFLLTFELRFKSAQVCSMSHCSCYMNRYY